MKTVVACVACVLSIVVVSALPPFDDFAIEQAMPPSSSKRTMRQPDAMRNIHHRSNSICRSSTWSTQVPCPSTLHQLEPLCVATVQLCDGVINCPLSEDEWPLTCALLKNGARSRTHNDLNRD